MAKMHISTTINGEPTEYLCEPNDTMLDVLRNELNMTGSKEGCVQAIAALAASRWTTGWSAPA